MKLITSLFFLLVALNILTAQNVANLSKTEMLADFDELIAFLNDFAAHQDLNAIRLGIDYDQQFKLLRDEITEQVSACEFRGILNRATNLIQDLHCSSMSSDYLSQYGKFQEKINFKHKEKAYEKLKSFEALCNEPKPNLTLPIIFSNGSYMCYADFVYKNDTIQKGSLVTSFNNSNIEEYIQNNPDKVWPIKVDASGKKYNERFYLNGLDSFELTFQTKTSQKTIKLNRADTIACLTRLSREIGFYSQKKEKVIAFENHGILYIRLPFMDLGISKSIINKIDSVTSKWKAFDKVVIDVRGNPGGTDLAWRKVIQHIISEPIRFDVNLKYRYNTRVIDHYNSKKETEKESIELLNEALYWSDKPSTIALNPDQNSLNFEGKIYVLQDSYIYSSAGNFSNLCLTNEQLVSVGNRTDLVGGLQKEPLFYQLKNSGLIYRVEPVLDFSNVFKLSDFAHNEVEVNIPETVNDRFLRTTHKDPIYSKKFLLNKDALMRYVIDQ